MTSLEQQENSFSNLHLSPQLTRAVDDMNYELATEIQAATIPFLLNGHDVIGHSSTGTGKTAAFGIPAVECVEGELKRAQVLVLSPTRELAMQIAREMQKYAKYKEGVSVAAVYGGASMSDQIRLLKRANIVIGTPGRLMDHMRRKTLKMDDIKMVVLDEADEMLSMGFIEDIQTILGQAPKERQTVLFSATMSKPILKISEEFLTKPQIVDVMKDNESQADIEQTYYYVPQHKKKEALTQLIQFAGAQRSIVFCNTKSMVDELAVSLSKQGFAASALHGDMTQAARSQVMQGFRLGQIQILIATDVAARGIDVDDVDVVINFDLPQSFEYYVHRIGRTGRAGKQGMSQTLVSNGKQAATLRSLMHFTGSEIKERRMPTGSDMRDKAVAKMAEELMPELQQNNPGNAAKALVKRLMGAETSGITTEQVACILAEKLIGGDEKFADIKGIETSRKAEAPRQSEKSGRGGKGDLSPMVAVTADIGRSARITPNHLVGAIAELLDVPGSSIGKIDISENSTSIGMREDTAYALIKHGKPVRIKGQPVTFTLQRKKSRTHSSPTALQKRYDVKKSRTKGHSKKRRSA